MGIFAKTIAPQQVIGVDIGGTAIKLGRFDRQGQCLQSLTIATPQPPQPEAVVEALVEAIAQLDCADHAVAAIGVGTPGPTNATGRVATVAINLGWQNVPLADWIEAKTGKPTILANDANCAGMGEFWLGAGRAYQDLIMLTLGTGVGGAVILNGNLFVGRDGTAGELGLISMDFDGPECNSGNQGSLEQHISVQAIRRRTGLEPDELGRRAKAGDQDAIAFWHHYGCELGIGLSSLIYVLTPEAVIIGGGVSASAEFFFPAALAELEKRVLPSSRAGLQLLTAELGNQAGMVGAARLAWQKLGEVAPMSAPADSAAIALQLQLQQAQLDHHLVVEGDRFKSGYLARTSHELRSPLNSVISLQQLILSDLCDNPEEERQFVAQANGAAMKMLAMLDQLIDVSKVAYGTGQLEMQPVQLAMVLHDVHHLTHMQAQNRSLRLEIAEPDPDLYVLTDPKRLQQVLVYLIDTPIALMYEGTIRLTVHPSPQTGTVQIWVEDERPAEAWQEPIDLLRSPQLALEKNSLSDAKLPSGLSLIVVHMLLELMQGQLAVLAVPSHDEPDPASPLTRLQCTIPLIVPDEEIRAD